MTTFTLKTTGNTINQPGDTGDTLIAATGTLNPGDSIDVGIGGTLNLTGSGAYDLSALTALAGIATLNETGSNQVVTTRAGLLLAITDSGNNDFTTLMDGADRYTDQGSGDTVAASAAILQSASITGNGGTTLQISQSYGYSLNLAALNISGLQYVTLTDSGTTIVPGASGAGLVYLQNFGETVSLDATTTAVVDYSGQNTVVFSAAATGLLTLSESQYADTLANFLAGDQVEITTLNTIAGQPTYNATTDTVTVAGTDINNAPVSLAFQLFGTYTGTFSLSTQAGAAGYFLNYNGTAPTDVAYLTTGDDTVGSGVKTVVATDGTLTANDAINAAPGATLDILGAGTFDLRTPVSLTGITTVSVRGAGANVTGRVGTALAFTLTAGGDQVYLVNYDDSLNGGLTGGNVVTVNASSKYARIDAGAGGVNRLDYIAPTTTGQTGFQDVAFTLDRGRDQNIQYASLAGVGGTFDPNAYGLLGLNLFGAAGTILLDNADPSVADYHGGNTVFFANPGGATQTLVMVNEGAVTSGLSTILPYENLYNFQAGDVVVLSTFASGTATYDASAGTVVVSGRGADGSARNLTFNINGNLAADPYTGTFKIVPDTTGNAPSGVDLIYTGPAPIVPVLTTGTETVGGLPAGTPILAGPGTLSPGDIIAGNGSELRLVGGGVFHLDQPVSLGGISGVAVNGQNQDVFARAGTAFTYTVNNVNDQIHLSGDFGTGDRIVEGAGSGNLAVFGTPTQIATATIVAGGVGNNTVHIDTSAATGQSATLGPNISGIQTVSLGSNGVTFDTSSDPLRAPLKVSIDTGYGTVAPDTIFLRGNGDELTDFYTSNTVYLYGRNQRVDIWADGTTKSETINSLFPSDTLHLWQAPKDATYTVSFNATQSVTTLTIHSTAADASPFAFTFLLGGYLTRPFTLTADPSQGIDIQYDVTCFASGTLIATPDGPRAVETISPGECVTLARGGDAPVIWAGRRTIDVARHPDPDRVNPVRIDAHAIAPGIPARALYVSPDHAIEVDGHLVLARMLCNGVSVTQVPAASVTYHHLELARHDVLLAEGCPAESYLDTGNRAMLDGCAPTDFAAASRLSRSVADGLPIATDAAVLRPIWTAIAARAGVPADAAGFAPGPGLRIEASGRVVPVHRDGACLTIALPRGATDIRLRSVTHVPAATAPWCDDRRRLGVAVRGFRVDGVAVPLDAPALAGGWHAPEPGQRWTAGDAILRVPPGARVLTVALA